MFRGVDSLEQRVVYLHILLSNRKAGLELVLEVSRRNVRNIVPNIVIGWFIDLCQLVLVGVDFVGSFLGSVSSNIADQDGGIVHCIMVSSNSISNRSGGCDSSGSWNCLIGLTKLAELAIGDDERAESSKTLQCLIAMLLGSLGTDRRTRDGSFTSLDLLCLPDEVLEKVAFVLAQEEVFGL